MAIFFEFFLYFEKLDHSNRHYGGGGAKCPRSYQSAKSPACLGLIDNSAKGGLTVTFYHDSMR